MSDLISFKDVYGIKPVFGGVYTGKPVARMCEEVELFIENGIHVYLEPLRFRNNAKYLSEDLKILKTF